MALIPQDRQKVPVSLKLACTMKCHADNGLRNLELSKQNHNLGRNIGVYVPNIMHKLRCVGADSHLRTSM